MTTMTPDRAWDTDQTLLCERLAERLRHQGFAHPVAAAVALAVRGSHAEDRPTFARRLGVPVALVEALDEGEVALERLPEPLLLTARHNLHLDLDHLAAVEQEGRP